MIFGEINLQKVRHKSRLVKNANQSFLVSQPFGKFTVWRLTISLQFNDVDKFS